MSSIAKIALDQVNMRLNAQLKIKCSTELRAIQLIGYYLTAVVIILFVIVYCDTMALALILPASAAVVLLLLAMNFAGFALMQSSETLPSRLPSDIWGDLTDAAMDETQFMTNLLASLQQPMAQNAAAQSSRSIALRWATHTALAAIPFALVAGAVALTIC